MDEAWNCEVLEFTHTLSGEKPLHSIRVVTLLTDKEVKVTTRMQNKACKVVLIMAFYTNGCKMTLINAQVFAVHSDARFSQ
jgi:hypothetical protein